MQTRRNNIKNVNTANDLRSMSFKKVQKDDSKRMKIFEREMTVGITCNNVRSSICRSLRRNTERQNT